MAFTHNVCGQAVKALCLMEADSSSNYWAVLCCPTCKTTVTQGECTGTFDSSIEIYGQEYIAPGAANTFLRSNGAGVAPTWETGPVGPKGDTGAAGAAGAAGLGFLFSEGHYNNSAVNNVGAAVNIADTFNNPDTGSMNVLGRHLVVKGSGSFTTAGGETPTFTLSCKFGGVEFITFTTGNLTAGVTGKFDFEFTFMTTTIGAAGDGIGRGSFNIQLAGPGAYTTYRNSGVVAAGINFTAAAGITLRVASSANINSVAIAETSGHIF